MGEDERADARRSTNAEAEVPLDVIPLHSTNLLTVLDVDGIIRYESPSIERVLGFDPAELVGEPVAEYFHPDDRERVLAAFQAVVESEAFTVEAVEYRHVQADGSHRWVESVAASNPTPEGYYVVNTRDISDRKARERALERTNERLNEFARIVSHDILNPLNVAQGRLDLARADGDPEHLDRAAEAVDRSIELIDDLRTLAREGDRALDLEAVALAETAAACWQNVETAGATLAVETDRTVLAHPSRLKQLLENLFRNAVEHAGDESTVTVGTLEDGFYVADDGPGISEAERPRVFETGYSTKNGGTGVGLGIVREVAEAHGWTVQVTDSERGGARFEFSGVKWASPETSGN